MPFPLLFLQSRPALLPAALLGVALLSGCGNQPDADPGEARKSAAQTTDAGPASAAKTCTAPDDWFPHQKTPKPDPGVDFDSFCKFHQWSWQSFLWLTQTDADGDQMRFERFPTAAEVVAGKSANPDETLHLQARTAKSDTHMSSLDAINQAGQAGVLVDHQGRAIYYSKHVNPTMFQDIVSQGWNDPEVLNSMSPKVEFKTGDVEIKAAWKIVSDGEDTSELITRQATINPLTSDNGKIVVNHDKTTSVQVALVGLHLAGWVKGHPEAIWATFEYRDNAPHFAPDQSMDQPVSDRDWLFYTGGTKALECNQLDTDQLRLDEADQTLSPITQVCRQYPLGMTPGSDDTKNDKPNRQAIEQLNQSVEKQLAGDSRLRHYFEVGAVWTDGNLKPNETLQDSLIGSRLLSNSVIETFTQDVASENNCFACHNTTMFSPADPAVDPMQGTNLNTSHIVLQAYLDNQPGETAEAAKQ